MLTGLAALITAVTGLIIGLRQIDPSAQNGTSSETPAPAAAPAGVVSEPEKTAAELLAAWNRGDRSAALRVAESSAVEKLFSSPSLKVDAGPLNCYVVGNNQRDCQLSHAKGILSFRLRLTTQGWWVEAVEY